MTLRDIFNKYVAPRGLKSAAHFGYALNAFARHLGHEATLDELNDVLMLEFRAALEKQGRARRTVENYVGFLKSLWRRAAKEGHITHAPTWRSTLPRDKDVAIPRVKRRLRKLALLIAQGKTLRVASRSVNVSYNTVLANIDHHRDFWKAERERAMKILLQDVRRRAERVKMDANEAEAFLADAARVDRWARKNGVPASGEEAADSLRLYVSRYAMSRDIGEATIDQYRYAVLDLDRWYGRPVRLPELTCDIVNQWLAKRLADGLARASMKGRRASIITLWRAAHDDGLIDKPPAKIRKVKVPRPIIDCWDDDQFAAIVAEAGKLEGDFRQCLIGRAALMKAALLTGYYTGLRPCDLLALPASPEIRAGERFIVRQAKTQHQIVCVLPPDAVEAIAATFPPERELLFPIDRKLYYQYVRDLSEKIGAKASPKWVRRTGATLLEVASPGSAMGFLGHLTPGLAYRHYVDSRRVQGGRPLPPPVVMR